MFHYTANQDSLAVAYRIHIHFDGIIYKTIQQYRGIMRNLDSLVHATFQLALLMDNFHGTPSQNIARAYDKRITYFPGGGKRAATSSYKPATMETGLVVMVPPFVLQGEKIKINTDSGEYIERA